MAEALVLYGAAAVLMAIVTALGFNIASDEKGTATINKMAEDLAKAVVPGVKIIAGTVAAGLSPNLLYIYMQLVNGKTSVPQNLISWVNQWLNDNKIYDSSEVISGTYKVGDIIKFSNVPLDDILQAVQTIIPTGADFAMEAIRYHNISLENKVFMLQCAKIYDDKGALEWETCNIRTTNVIVDSLKVERLAEGGTLCRYPPKSTTDKVIDEYYYDHNWTYNTWKRQHTQSVNMGFVITPVIYKSIGKIDISNYGSITITGNDTGFEAGENVPGKDVVIPGEGTEGITNEDIVGWLKSAVGQAVSEALGIGTEELQYVPVGIENPALSGEVSDVLANAATQDKVQTGVTAADIVQSGNNTANITISQNTPVSSVKTSSLYTIWNPTQEQLNSLANFLWSTDFVDLIKKVLQSPMDAMISLALFPIRPKTDGTHIINLGYVPSGVSALRVSDQFQTFQTSGLVIPHKYNSYLDYSPYTTAEIYLPFIGFQRLNINDVMGKTVSVVYNIDMLSGICTALVKVDDNTMYS